MDLNQFTQYFNNPKVSVFNRSSNPGFPMRIGPLYPAYWDLCSFGNSHQGTSFHSMRLAPLLAPTFSDLRLQEHAAVIPLRVIMEDFEQTFNYATNVDGASLPHFTSVQYHNLLRGLCAVGLNPIGSLLDFLGFPVYGDLYKVYRSEFANFTYTDETDRQWPLTHIPSDVSQYQIRNDINGIVSYRGLDLYISEDDFSRGPKFYTFYNYVVIKTFNLPNSIALSDLYPYIEKLGNPTSLDELINNSIFETVTSAMNSYLSYVFGLFLRSFLDYVNFTEGDDYSTLPLRAYWRFHYDWNTNGNFTNRDIELENNVYYFEHAINLAVRGALSDTPTSVDIKTLSSLLYPANRLWDNDFFTSLLPTSAVDNAIQIPANSTVLDLAKLTAIQKLVLKLSYSSRYRDVVWNIFKIKPSDARLQQSSPIKQKTHQIGIGETLQTSETSVSSVQGNMAGRGYSSGKNEGYHIFCEEPCVIMQFVSFVPRAVYADSLHPLIHTNDILDFPIPDMDVLGNQPVKLDLLTGNVEDSQVILGYGRQYQEWLATYNSVHGEFKTTLSYWKLLRRFTDRPALNEDFLRIDDHDDLDEIFSIPDAEHAYIDIFYKCRASRHVHRNVRIQI